MYGKWFECKVSLKRTLEDGLQKQVKEVYIVDAVNFTEAEARILDETKVYGVAMISIDESAGKEKKVNVIYYVRAKDFKSAFENTEKWLGGSVMDSTIISIAETNIMEVFEYKKMPE